MRTATRYRISTAADVALCSASLSVITGAIFFVSDSTPTRGLSFVGLAVALFLASWSLARMVRRHDYHRRNRSRRSPGRNIHR
jgi:hypothetical protein